MKTFCIDILLVGAGSFIGGCLRFLTSKLLLLFSNSIFPFGTFAVNIIGCFLIGMFSTLPANSINPQTRLLLTTGLCGGFTTFSTFMNEGVSLTKSGNTLMMLGYVFLSLFLGFVAVILGQQVALKLHS